MNASRQAQGAAAKKINKAPAGNGSSSANAAEDEDMFSEWPAPNMGGLGSFGGFGAFVTEVIHEALPSGLDSLC
jgi:hypothetical protein